MNVSIRVACAALLGSVPALAGQVVIVEGAAAGTYPDVQAAVDAAFDGDILLIGPGTYSSFTIDGKGLSLFAMGVPFGVHTPVAVENLAPDQTVVLSGLLGIAGPVPAFLLANDEGHVRIQDCSWTVSGTGTGGHGVKMTNCDHVTFVSCQLKGSNGFSTSPCNLGGTGGSGLLASNSTVALFDSTLVGGSGGDGQMGSDGGCGLQMSFGTVFAAGSSFTGKNGGDGLPGCFGGGNFGGDGGSGLSVFGGTARVLANQYAAGFGGLGANSWPPGLDGRLHPVFPAGGLTTYTEVVRRLSGGRIVDDSGPSPLTLNGEAGDVVRLRMHRRAAWVYGAATIGPWLVPPASLPQLPLLGVVPPSLTLQSSYLPRPLAQGHVARVDVLQAASIDPAGNLVLSNPLHVLVFDDAAGPDCNGNHVPDVFDIAVGTSADLDHDGVPDECP